MSIEYWQIEGSWPGQLRILARPRGGDWLDFDIQNWSAQGIDHIVSLLEDQEVTDLDLEKEGELCQRHGMGFESVPIPDRGIPAKTKTFDESVERALAALESGQSVGVHCRQGIGRSGLFVAAVLVSAGLSITDAIQRVSAARGRPIPETDEQRNWLFTWARSHSHASSKRR